MASLQHLVDEADDRRVFGRVVEVVYPRRVAHRRPGRPASSSSVSIVSAPTPSRFFISRWIASLEASTGLRFKPGHRLERIQSLRGEQAAGRHFDRAVHAAQRQQFFLQQNARGEQREQLPIRFDVLQRRITQAIFIGQPAQHIFFSLKRPPARAARRLSRRWRTIAARQPSYQAVASWRRGLLFDSYICAYYGSCGIALYLRSTKQERGRWSPLPRQLTRAACHRTVLQTSKQSGRSRNRFLPDRQNCLQVGLRGFHIGHLLLAGFLETGQ